MKAVKIVVFLLVAAILGFFAIGLFTPSFTYETRIHIDAPVAKTFSIIDDPNRMHEWMDGFESFRNVSGQPRTVGSVSELVVSQEGEQFVMRETLTAWEENARIAFELDNNVMLADVDLRFSPSNGGTAFTEQITVHGKNIFWRSLLWLARAGMQTGSQENYARLKAIVERES